MPENAQLDTSNVRARPLASVDLSVPVLMVTRNLNTDFRNSENVWYTNTSSTKPSADAISHDCCMLFENLIAEEEQGIKGINTVAVRKRSTDCITLATVTVMNSHADNTVVITVTITVIYRDSHDTST